MQAMIIFNLVTRVKPHILVTEMTLYMKHNQMRREMKQQEKSLSKSHKWISGKYQILVPIEEKIQYRYSVTWYNEKSSAFFNRTAVHTERQWRQVSAPKELFDVFEHPDDKLHQQQLSAFLFGSCFYVSQFIPFSNEKTMTPSLLKVKEIEFPGEKVTQTFASFFVKWVQVEMEHHRSSTQ